MKITISIIIFLVSLQCFAQENSIKIYNPDADAETELIKAIEQAQKYNKHVFIQLGGNWCSWCIKFHKFVKENHDLDSIINANYIVLKINYSREKQNTEIFEKFEYPQRFGFPVFVILDSTGKRIHTQNSGLLEKDKSYDIKKVKYFFLNWTAKAIDPEQY